MLSLALSLAMLSGVPLSNRDRTLARIIPSPRGDPWLMRQVQTNGCVLDYGTGGKCVLIFVLQRRQFLGLFCVCSDRMPSNENIFVINHFSVALHLRFCRSYEALCSVFHDGVWAQWNLSSGTGTTWIFSSKLIASTKSKVS